MVRASASFAPQPRNFHDALPSSPPQNVRDLFPSDWNPFYAGFGNRFTDEISYQHVGIPDGKVFTINPKGEISGVNTCNAALRSLHDLFAHVHSIFPPLTDQSEGEREEYNDYLYWKVRCPRFGPGGGGADESGVV